jgi:NhaP-type Na+/H+ or K+/H+ antiporter
VNELLLAVMLFGIVVIAGVSERVRNTIITLPMLYTLFGLGVALLLSDHISLTYENPVVEIVGKLTLLLLLASDSSRIAFGAVLKNYSLPLRLLGIGLPLTIALGTLISFWLFGKNGIWPAAILAVILAPTDDSIAESVIDNPKVPARIRQALNIEGGLNDGITMPFLLLFIALAASSADQIGSGIFLKTLAAQIGLGLLVGATLGYLGDKYISSAGDRGWMSPLFQKLAALALTILVFVLAEAIGGNGFVAASAFGLTVGNTMAATNNQPIHEFGKTEYTLLMMLTYMFFGMAMLPQALAGINLTLVLYAALSLTVVRMAPVAISLIGSHLRPVSVLFVGWFGPRGIASILYVLLVMDEPAIGGKEIIFNAAMLTVFFSILLHGVTAAPFAKRYGERMSAMQAHGSADAEAQSVPEVETRSGAFSQDTTGAAA